MKKEKAILTISKAIFITIITILNHGCDQGVCITPDSIYTESTTVVMEAYPKEYTPDEIKDNPWLQYGWRDSGFSHDGDEINIKTVGNADMCGLTSQDRKSGSTVPDSQLKDGHFTSDFSKSGSVTTNFQTTVIEDSIIEVLPKDVVSFSLDKIEFPVNCDNPTSNINVVDKDICKNGTEMTVEGEKIKVEPYEGKTIGVDYGSDPKNIHNIVFFNGVPRDWVIGGVNGFYDTMIPQIQNSSSDTPLDNCQTFNADPDSFKSKFTAYYINKVCKRVCADDDDTERNCGTSVKLTKQADINNPISISQDIYLTNKLQAVLKTTQGNTMLVESNGHTALNKKYAINSSGKISFAKTYIPNVSKGGLKIKITRDCTQRAMESLYIYMGSQPPTNPPGKNSNDKRIIDLKNIDPPNTQKTINTLATHAYLIEKGAPSGRIYIGFKTEGDIVENNTGAINVMISKPRTFQGTISKGVKGIKDGVLNLTEGRINPTTNLRSGGAADEMYEGIMRNPYFKSIIYAVLILYITLQGLFYFTGMAPMTKENLIINLIKISLVVSILSPSTFQFYRNTMQSLFLNGMDVIINSATAFDANSYNSETDFSFMDSSLGRFTIHETGIQLFALFLSGPLGWVVLLAIIGALIVYGFVVFKAIVFYIMNIILIVFLTSLLPLFMLTLLFKYTAKIFHSWFKVIMTNVIKPILLFLTLAILNQLMMAAFYGVFNFTVCDGCALSFRIIPEVAAFCLINGPIPVGYEPILALEEKAKRAAAAAQTTFFTLPVKVEDIFIMLFIATSAKIMADKSGTIASSITSTFGGSISWNTVGNMFNKGLGLIGMDKESRERRARSYYKESMARKASLNEKEKQAVRNTGVRNSDGTLANAPGTKSGSSVRRPNNDLDLEKKNTGSDKKGDIKGDTSDGDVNKDGKSGGKSEFKAKKSGGNEPSGGGGYYSSIMDDEIYDTIDDSSISDTWPQKTEYDNSSSGHENIEHDSNNKNRPELPPRTYDNTKTYSSIEEETGKKPSNEKKESKDGDYDDL